MAEQPYLFGPLWIPIKDGNPTAMSIFKRHYTARQRRKVEQFIGPREKEALITPGARALFAWRKFISDAGERGVNCAVFRNEHSELARSSELISAACEIAWNRWPGERLYTYIDPAKTQTIKHHSQRIVGFCFRKAGWKPLVHKDGNPVITKSGLHVLVKLSHAPQGVFTRVK
jgi:hypothetical protein